MASAFELLRRSRTLPLGDRPVAESEQLALAGAAWGKKPRAWRPAETQEEEKEEDDDEAREEGRQGGAMPRELRALAAASFDVFARVSRVRPGPAGVPASELLRASREYREALTTCIFALEDKLERRGGAAADEEMEERGGRGDGEDEEDEFVDLLKVSLAVWHLCELLLLQRGAWNDRWAAYELAQWLQEHYASAAMDRLERESARLAQAELPEQDEAFWPTVWSLAMAGAGGGAWRLLAAHSSYKSLLSREVTSLTGAAMRTSFQRVQRVLQRMPGRSRLSESVVSASDASSDADDWSGWRADCEDLLSTDSYVKSHGELTTLLKILVADEHTLLAHVDSWYELMMARLFLEEPKRVAHRFEFLMANCFQAVRGHDAQMGNFDCIMLAILQYDVQSALQDIIGMGLSWMAAHLTDLLEKSGVVSSDVMPDSECSLRERFLLEYALELSATSGMWQFVAGYCEQCPRFGQLVVVSIIDREPVPTDRKASSLLNYCQGKAVLAKSQRTIAVRRANQLKHQKSYGAALVWLLRACHHNDVDDLCEVVLKECESTGSFAPLNEAVEFLDSSDVHLSLPMTLQWLSRYRELNLVLEDRRHLGNELANSSSSDEENSSLERKYRFVSAEAARRLDELLTADGAPRSLRVRLLEEAERLLEMSPSVFEPHHLYSLMAFISKIDRSFDAREAFGAQSAGSAVKERVEQLALRNLSEALLSEPLRSSGPAPGSADAFRDGVNSSAFVGGHHFVTAGATLTTPMEE